MLLALLIGGGTLLLSMLFNGTATVLIVRLRGRPARREMMLPLLVGLGVLVVSLMTYGVATAFLVQIVARFFRSHAKGLTISKDVAVMTLVGLVTTAAHLTQIAIWACV